SIDKRCIARRWAAKRITGGAMAVENEVRSQMNVLIEEHRQLLSHCATIKRWCLTLWVGILVAGFGDRAHWPLEALMSLQVFSVLAFWSLEAAYGATIVRRQRQIRRAEKLLRRKDLSETARHAFSLYPYSVDHRASRAQKWRDLWEAIRTEETM